MIFSYKPTPIFHLDCGLTRTTLKGLRREKRFLKQVLHIIVPEIKHNRNRLCQALVVFNDPQVTTIIISMSCPELLSWFSFKFNQVYVPCRFVITAGMDRRSDKFPLPELINKAPRKHQIFHRFSYL